MKGHDRAYVRVTSYGKPKHDDQGREIVNYDEIEHNFSVRYMAAPEAHWRMSGYPIVDLSHPVEKLYVHVPGGSAVVYAEEDLQQAAEAAAEADEKTTKLTAFFDLCSTDVDARQLTYPEVPLHYRFDAKIKAWVKRKNNVSTVVRVGSVVPTNRQAYAIRLLLFLRRVLETGKN
ncbi:hypothetical protein L596_030690 [Steinernema carpocapsae]|uniref:Uncharacterized protein n=1 Tax=Steinernema carpocapsae TaxID=34508 RepID=A0A4U5LNG9_STECR|nr:hypothetical protein L596_030690 [Steinernema carpocapsae]